MVLMVSIFTVLPILIIFSHTHFGRKSETNHKNDYNAILIYFFRTARWGRKIPLAIGLRTVRWSSSQNFVARRYHFLCSCLFWGRRWIHNRICRTLRYSSHLDCQCRRRCMAGEYSTKRKSATSIWELLMPEKRLLLEIHFSKKAGRFVIWGGRSHLLLGKKVYCWQVHESRHFACFIFRIFLLKLPLRGIFL